MAEVELQQIGPYRITDLLRVSSTSTFYRSKQRNKDIIIKRLNIPLTTIEAREAFLTRARQLKKLKHRNCVNTLDIGFDGDYAYLVMEYAAGETLRQRVGPGERLAPDEVRRLLSPIADALHYGHVMTILHGNLHPGNLLIDAKNNTLLTEFSLTLPGLPLPLDDEAFAIPYMAPEHLRDQPVAASDQYALAVIAYELLCGRRPYEATERELLLQQQEQASFPPPRSLNDAISPDVEQVIIQALARKPEGRFPHVLAFADAYLRALMHVPFSSPGGLVNRAPTRQHTPSPSTSSASGAHAASHLHTPHQRTTETPGSKGDENGTDQPGPTPAERDDAESEAPRSAATKRPRKSKADLHVIAGGREREDATANERPTRDKSRLHLVPAESDNGHLEEREERKHGQTKDERAEQPSLKPALASSPPDSRLQTTVAADLRQGGVLSQSLPGYEERPAQIEMAMLVARSLTQNVPAIAEASTGTGKSLSYLIPVVRSGKVAIVSTANKALQEQLFYKDIPFVQQHIRPFEAALVKGVSNYVCLDRVESERVGMQFYAKNRDFKRLLTIIEDPAAKFMGDFETLDFQLPADIRSRIATDSDQCAWSKCGFFGDCYVRQMRERAEMAQVIVVNHTLLLLDAAIGGFLLPERDVIILDEAHHLEEEATRSFTITINAAQIQTLLAQRMLKDHSQLSLQDDALRMAHNTWLRLEQVANPGFKGRTNLEEPLEEGLRLATVIADLADSLRKQRPKDMPEKETQLYDKLLKRTQNLADNIRTVFSVAHTDKFVYYVDRVEGTGARSGFPLQASAAPLDVTVFLKEKLFDKCNVICTSATLATIGPNPMRPEEKGPNFAYFRRRVGLDPLERPDVLECVLPLAFDYENNALLYLPRDLPAPAYGVGSDDYMKSIAREMYRLVKLSRGRAFLLFSSKRMLERAYELMSPHLSFPLLKQGDMTRLELTRRFREEEGAVLFGLKSFWEGVDIAGDALSLVVIDKLPFDPPDDPVHEARVALMKAAGENWFGTYVLPQAVLRLKQGLGRLLRTREDRGVMAILDTRLHTKGYGKLVLNALPPARRTSSLKDVERFFAQ
jgi:Rad3-related DNA helicase/serine/threonine protein kinase